MANVRNFEPTAIWANPDGTLTERARGWTRSVFDYIGAGTGVVPIGTLGLDNNAVHFLDGTGTPRTPDYPTGANPTGSVGTSAVNGSATTFMRSDAAPALNLGITPTWTGAHTFTAATTMAALSATSGAFSTTMTVTGGFGCNGAAAQTEVTVNAAVAGTAGAVYTATEQGMINDSVALLNQIRAALVANGIAV